MVDKTRTTLRHTQPVFLYEIIDAQAIPYADQTFDTVLANHMLYHVPDRPRALREIHRVLKPDGTLYATVNSLHHFEEVYDLIQEINSQAHIELSQTIFGLENGVDQVAKIFTTVSSEVFDSTLAITASPPLLAYLQLSRHGDWIEDREAVFQERVDHEIRLHGALHVNTRGGLIIARK